MGLCAHGCECGAHCNTSVFILIGGLGDMPDNALDGVQVLGDEPKVDEQVVVEGASGFITVGDSSKKRSKDQAPFKMGDGLPAVPPKLVAKIRRGEFVDMAELLKYNLEADRRRTIQGGAAATAMLWIAGKSAGTRREVPDILSCVQCFSTYACVLGDAFPQKARELWAYRCLMVREARRCGETGWRDYDCMFRQQAASAVELEWDKLNSSLYAVTFLAHQSGRGKVCRWCQGTDHSSGECALGLDRASNRTVSPTRTLVAKEFRSAGVSRGKGSAEKICFSWNNGKCRFQPYCRFRHVCSTAGCQEDHRAVDCARAKSSEQKTSEGVVGVKLR